MKELDQMPLILLEALTETKELLVGAIVGGILGFLLSIVFFVYGIWMIKKGWPELGETPWRRRIQVIVGLVWFFTLPGGLSLCGSIQGAKMGALRAIDKGQVVEDATVAGFKSVGPILFAAVSSLPETSEQFPVENLREGIGNLKGDLYSELRATIRDRTGDQKLLGSIAAFFLEWLAKTQVEKFVAYGTDVLEDLERKNQLEPTADEISASVGAVHFKPVARDGVQRISRIYFYASLIPVVLISFLPVVLINWWCRRKKGETKQAEGMDAKQR